MAEKHGAGEPTVLAFHGWGRSRHDWARTLEGLNALAIDLPGFGATPAPDAPWSVRDYADLLLPLLNKSAPRILVGHSFGGRVAVRMAAENPASVRGLVLTGVPLLRTNTAKSRPPMVYRAVRTLHNRGFVPDEWIERARQRYGSADYKASSGAMRGVLVKAVAEDYADCLEVLRSAEVPVALIWGQNDSAVPACVAEKAQSALGPRSSLELVPGSAHLLDDSLARHIRAAIEVLNDTQGRVAAAGDGTAKGLI